MKLDFNWMGEEKNIKKMIRISILVLILLVVVDLFLHHDHGFEWTRWAGFSAVYGYLSCVVIIVVSKFLGKFLKKKEDYYE